MNTEPSNPASNTMGTKGVTPESNKSTPGAVPKSVIHLKLLVDVENSRVLFAEADKKLVDFLFGLIRMRVGSMVSLLGKKSMVGSIDNLYESVEELNNQYLLYPNRSKYELLQPRSVPRFTGHRIQPVLKSQGNIEKKKFFTCPDHDLVGSLVAGGKCPKCKQSFMREVEVVEPNAPIGNNIGKKKKRVGFVKEVVKYMITDELEVTPLSAISGLDIIRKFNIKDISALEKRTIEVGIDEARDLAKAALQSKAPLTDVFLPRLISLASGFMMVAATDS